MVSRINMFIPTPSQFLTSFKLRGGSLLNIPCDQRPDELRFDNIHKLIRRIKDGGSCLREINHTILGQENWWAWRRITLAELRQEGLLADEITKDNISEIYHFKL